MAMFCEFAGKRHKVNDVAPVTHYLRHQCTNCSYYAIFELCAQCAKLVDTYIDDGSKWAQWYPHHTWCPKCRYRCWAKKVWTVYENKEG